MTTFQIPLNHLKSVELILAALYMYDDSDASILADGIQNSLICLEDGVPTYIGGVPIDKQSNPQPVTPLKDTKKYPPLRLVKGGKNN